MSSEFSWWENALKGLRGPIFDGEPNSGFYRAKNKDKATGQITYSAVAYWKDQATGDQRCHRNGREWDMQRALESWPYVSLNPITQATYWAFIDNGKWPDVDSASHEIETKGPEIDPQTDPAGSLKAELEKAKTGADAYKIIESDEAMTRAQTLRSTLAEIKNKANNSYEALNRPLLDQQAIIRKIWFPIRDEAAALNETMRKAMEAWNDIKRANEKRAQDERDRLAREAQEEQERRDRAHELAMKAAEEANEPAPPPPEPVAPLPTAIISQSPAPSTRIKGASGRTAAVGVEKIVVVDDQDAVYAFLKGDEVAGGLIAELLQRLAQVAVTAGRPVPGIHIDERSKIRG